MGLVWLAKRRKSPQLLDMPTSFALLSHRSVIALTGQDRVEFLQGLISNDTTKVSAGQAIWAALLTPQGRFLNDMFVSDGGSDTLLIETERDRAAALAKKLTMYTLRSKVKVEDRSGSMEVAVVFGDNADKALGIEKCVSYVDPRLPALGVRVLAPTGEVAAILGSHGFAPAMPADYDALRLPLGVPDGSRDLPVEKALLLESGFDELNGVDWKKGCYMGQELTARTKYRGLVKKRLFPVRIEGALPVPGTIVELEGQDVGELRSGAGDRAIAMLRLDAARGDGPLTSGGARIVPEIPAWMRLPESSDP